MLREKLPLSQFSEAVRTSLTRFLKITDSPDLLPIHETLSSFQMLSNDQALIEAAAEKVDYFGKKNENTSYLQELLNVAVDYYFKLSLSMCDLVQKKIERSATSIALENGYLDARDEEKNQ